MLAQSINAALPQTQCTRCGYPDCASYALAVAEGRAGINQCPPGGAEGVARLARLTGLPVGPVDASHGIEAPRNVAFIDEAWCIGCTLCIKACPTDAIVGSNKWMHTVIEPYCTGCELCIPVCPVDCIHLENASGSHTGWDAWSPAQATEARERYERRTSRLADDNSYPSLPSACDELDPLPLPPEPSSQPMASSTPRSNSQDTAVATRKAAIAAALERARQRQQGLAP